MPNTPIALAAEDVDEAESVQTDRPAQPPVDSPGGLDLTFRPDIEGLRAIAVLLVVLYHAQVGWLAGGYVGVDVFFVLSGFLITGLLLKEHQTRGRVSILGFYARRTRRILPAAMVVIILTVATAYFTTNEIDFANFAQDGRWATGFLANFHFWSNGAGYFTAQNFPSPLLHYWSLAVEEQFYLVWPLAILFVGFVLRRINIRYTVFVAALIGTVVSVVWCVNHTTVDSVGSYFSPYTRAWELGLGAILATMVPLLQRVPARIGVVVAWLGLIAVALAAVLYTKYTVYPGAAALVPVLGAGAVVAGGASGAGATHFLGLRPLRSIGRVSYGWYLLHYPLMILLVGAAWSNTYLSVEENLLIAAATLIAAYVMYYVLESPVRRSTFLARHPWISIAVGAVFVASAYLFCSLLHPSIHHLWFTG